MLNIKWFGIDTVDGIGIFFIGVILFLIGLAIAIVVCVILWSTISSIIERYIFFSRLKFACRGTALRCKKQHSLIRSFFNSYKGTDFIIYKNEKELVHLKFFPYFLKARQNFLHTDGILERRFMLIFWKSTNYWIRERKSREFTAKHWYFFWFNVFHSYRKTKLDFNQTDVQRILLLPNDDVLLSISCKNTQQIADNSIELCEGTTLYSQKRVLEKLRDM